MKKLWIILAALLIVGCTPKKELQRFSQVTSEAGFDTSVTLLAYAKNQREFDQYFDITKKEFLHYNSLFDKYNTYEGINNIKTINDNAGKKPIKVDPELFEMMVLSKSYAEQANGYFDISYGAVLEIWHDYQEAGQSSNAAGNFGAIPKLDVLENASIHTGWDKVELDEAASTVFLNDPEARLDVGAIAKGFATEKVALKLMEEGLKHAVLSGGGNIRTINDKPDGSGWKIGVQEPADADVDSNIDTFTLPSNMSVVTSGDYQRYFNGPEGKRYSHLINPKTHFPDSDFRSVTIFTPDSGIADALSTVLYLMSYNEGTEFVKAYNLQNPDKPIEVMWVANNHDGWETSKGYSFTITDGLKQYSNHFNASK